MLFPDFGITQLRRAMHESAILLSQISRPPAPIQGVVLAFVLHCCVITHAVRADENPDANPQIQINSLATDRKTTLTLESFRRHIANSADEEALEDFRRLQTSDASVMVPVDEDRVNFVPLYRAVFGAFFELPAATRQRVAGALEFTAQQRLQQIMTDGDFHAAPDLILRYAGTDASMKAHILLARFHVDRGNRLGAKTWLAPLLKEGVNDSYRRAAAGIRDSLSPYEAQPEAGNFVGNDSSDQQIDRKLAIPRHLQWQIRSEISPNVQKQLDSFLNISRAANVLPQASWSDLIDRDTAYRRTVRGLMAVDLKTGMPRWQYPIEPRIDVSLSSTRRSRSTFNRTPAEQSALNKFAAIERSGLVNLFCRDNITGQIAGDSQRLFLVAGIDDPVVTATASAVLMQSRSTRQFRGSHLIAVEKATGRRIWTAGRETFRPLGKKLAAAWFAGVPRVFRNQLFCVIEWNGEIKLACLRSRTGELIWVTDLVWPEQSIGNDPVRRLWSATPSVSEGVVWCPTTTGWMLCVDQVTHSILWARSIGNIKKDVGQIPRGRGRPVMLTPSASIRECWARSTVMLAGDRLVVLPHEAHEIYLLDAVTGRAINRISPGISSFLVHLDSSSLIVCEQSRLVCRNVASGKEVWSRDFSPSVGLPTGRAVARGSSLLLPMTTGTILQIDSASGKTVSQTAEVLQPSAWGRLVQPTEHDNPNDLLFATPDRLLRLTTVPPVSSPVAPIERASHLFATGEWQQALSIAEQIPADGQESLAARSLCFDCRLHLAAQEPEVHLPQLKKMARSPKQRISLLALETRVLRKQKNFLEAAKRVTDLLQLESSLLSRNLPDDDFTRPSSGGTADNVNQARMSVQTWAAKELSSLLSEITDPTSILEHIDGVSTGVLLRLRQPAVLPAIYDRISSAGSIEAAVQLLQHAVRIQTRAAQGNSPDFTREVALLNEIIRRVQRKDDTPARHAAMMLLNVNVLEMPSAYQHAVQSSDVFQDGILRTNKAADEEFQLQLKSQFAEWAADSYRTVPVARLRSFGRVQKSLALAGADDSFLSRYQWSATSGEYGRLQAQDVIGGKEKRWSVPGNYQLHGTYSFQKDMLLRVGSVLLLKSYSTITAVSPLEQRMLWSRNFGSAAIVASSSRTENFARFDPRTVRLPSQRLTSSTQIVGSGHGWLATTHGAEFSMIDIYTGNTIWSVTLPNSGTAVVASGSRVQMTAASRPVAVYDANDGAILRVPVAGDPRPIPIRNIEDHVVCWTQSVDAQNPRLQWIDPATNEVIDEVSLSEMQRFQFVDDRLLAGFGNRGQMLIVDLKTRALQQFSLSANGLLPPESTGLKKDEADDPADLPFWDPARLQVSTDALNLYVCNRRRSGAKNVQTPSNRRLTMFEGGLRVLDRKSGKLRWSLENCASQMSTTDQPELPLLMLIESRSSKTATGSTMGTIEVQGISKLTGKQLFRQTLPAQSGIRTLSLSTPGVNTLDIGVQGLRVRIEAVSN